MPLFSNTHAKRRTGYMVLLAWVLALATPACFKSVARIGKGIRMTPHWLTKRLTFRPVMPVSIPITPKIPTLALARAPV